MKTKSCFSMTTHLFFIFVFCLICQPIFAVPADPDPFEYELPDGSTITIKLEGDEWISWNLTEDEYTILLNREGFWEYAVKDENDDLVLSGIRAKNLRDRSAAESDFLRGQQRNLRYSRSQINALLQMRATRAELEEQIDIQEVTGNVRIPVILVAFPAGTSQAGAPIPARPFTSSKTLWEDLFNQPNYRGNNATGSLHDYFRDVSHGRLNIEVSVYGPVTMPRSINWYDHRGDGGSGAGGRMARAAVDTLVARGEINFANYPHPSNNTDAAPIHIIYAGYGQSSGARANESIWAHASSVQGTPTIHGRRVRRYSCSQEYANTSGTTMRGIGVVAHELGHSLLGWPDFYDTDYAESGGTSVHLSSWCLMASGSSNGSGRTPPFPSAYLRILAGWATSTTLTTPQDVTLPNPVYNPGNTTLARGVAYRINTRTSTGADDTQEYFLLENRQRVGWDAFIPASGMLIYRVDRRVPGWTGNRVNASPTNRGHYIEAAGCTNPIGCTPRSNDPFPRSTFNSFTDTSVPHSRSRAGVNTARPITDITHNTTARTISFRFMGGTPATSINNYKKFDGKHGIVVSQNPVFGDQAEFMIKTPEAAQINIRILDNLGNTVLETNGRNDETFVWDLRNNAGRFVANGVYLILVEATGINQRRFTYSAQMGVKR